MLKIKGDAVEKAIQEVAESIILPRYQNLKSHDIHFKSEDNPVTIADLEAESALKERLLDLLPNANVVGEEGFAANRGVLEAFACENPVWIIDPLDGTKAFIAGEPFYGVIVALAEQNQTLAAWLYDATSKEFVTAEKGAGAYHKGRRLSVLAATKLSAMSGVTSTYIKEEFDGCTPSVETGAPTFYRMLSACHDYARLVVDVPHFSGKASQVHFHTFLKTCTPWDCAAGILIHAEAGGYTAHWNGDMFQPSHYGRGILSAPDKDSWLCLRDWIASFCTMPE